MKEPITISYESATYRLVGVITIGVTQIPVVGFGYPEELTFQDVFRDQMQDLISNHEHAILEIEHLSKDMDRVTWCVLNEQPSETKPFSELEIPFYLYLDLPMMHRQERIGTILFTDVATEVKGFLVAVTAEDTTYLNFYNLKMVKRNQETKDVEGLIGEISKHVSGPAVPLLRTIETLQSQIGPQRKIEISDEELGIIYKALTGEDA